MSIKLRLRELRLNAGLRQEDIGNLFNMKRSAVSQWESGVRMPDLIIISKLADYFHCSTDYLLGRSNAKQPLSLEDLLEINSTNTKAPDYMIPVVNNIAACGALSSEDIEAHRPVDLSVIDRYGPDLSQFFYLRLKDDSMEPVIKEGDLVLIKKGPIEHDGIAAVICGDKGFLRQVRFVTVDDKDYIVLVSLNQHYSPQTYLTSECHIVGKAIWRTGPLVDQ